MKIEIKMIDFSEKSILEHALKNNIDVQYNCKDGFCGACAYRLVSGNVKYTKDVLSFLPKEHIAICSCIPESDIVLDI